MRKLTIPMLVAALAALTLAGGTTAQNGPPAGKKTWICHLANAHKYVAIQVSNKALATHLRHGPDIVAGVPQTRAAARTFCRSQVVLTPQRGGQARSAELASAANQTVTGQFRLRARVGQGQLCFAVSVSGATDISSLAITGGGSPIVLDVSGTDLTESGCVNLSRATVKQLLKSSDDFTVTAVVATAGGAVTLTGTLER